MERRTAEAKRINDTTVDAILEESVKVMFRRMFLTLML